MNSSEKQIGFFEKYLTVWVLVCIVAGIALGSVFQQQMQILASWNYHGVNLPVAILIWAMIYPMMLQIDFSSLRKAAENKRGLGLTVVVNWLIKPFTMTFFAYIFFKNIYSAWISPELADQYIAGAILLGAAPCTAMVFVWSYLVNGNANYTLVQVTVNDLIILIAFIPIVQLLLGVSSVTIPFDVLAASVVVFVVVPLFAGYFTNRILRSKKGDDWFNQIFLPKLKPVSIIALLTTLILIFAFQGDVIINNPFHILLIAVPLTIQTYFIFFVTWIGGRKMGLPHPICAPAAMIGASNFF